MIGRTFRRNEALNFGSSRASVGESVFVDLGEVNPKLIVIENINGTQLGQLLTKLGHETQNRRFNFLPELH